MFSDPQSVKPGQTATAFTGGTAQSLPRTGSGLNIGEFKSSDGNYGLTVRHTTGKGRLRHSIRFYNRKVATDPLDSTLNAYFDMAVSVTVDRPVVGYTVAEAKAIVDGIVTYLATTSGASITQLLGGES